MGPFGGPAGAGAEAATLLGLPALAAYAGARAPWPAPDTAGAGASLPLRRAAQSFLSAPIHPWLAMRAAAAPRRAVSDAGGPADRLATGYLPDSRTFRQAAPLGAPPDRALAQVQAARAAQADKWSRMTREQRFADPELRDTAIALEAAKRLIQKRDRALGDFLGTNLRPESDFVAGQIMAELESRSMPERIKKDGPVSSRSAGGRGGYPNLFETVRDAARRALNARQKQALDFFMRPEGGGWSKEQAVAIVANLTVESNLDPGKRQHGGGGGLAIAMWDKDRARRFAQFAGHSLAGSTFEQQLAFVAHELMESPRFKPIGDELRQAKTLHDATRLVAAKYEAMARVEERYLVRTSEADAIYKEFYQHR